MGRRSFDIPESYRSGIIGRIKQVRAAADPRRKDFSPILLDFGPVRFRIPRHFGFCYGVENAIEIAYRTVAENRGRNVFLLSEMIHNPLVNSDLEQMGVRFLMSTSGEELIPFSSLTSEDIVIVPAFGTTLEMQRRLKEKGIDPYQFDTTCPFVQKVWNRSASIGKDGFSIVVHGKPRHEETRATFSHSADGAPTVVVRNMEETELLAEFIAGRRSLEDFPSLFEGQVSEGFDPDRDLRKLGVVNQTTMLASETQAIASRIRAALVERYGQEEIGEHFADTRDTLCYATNENQGATIELIKEPSDIAIVVGGYNSSNTSHLVELAEEVMPTYFIKGAEEILGAEQIQHFDLQAQERVVSKDWLANNDVVTIALTSGASCPDAVVDRVLRRILECMPGARSVEETIGEWKNLLLDAGHPLKE